MSGLPALLYLGAWPYFVIRAEKRWLLLLDLSSSVRGNYNAGKTQRFTYLCYILCHNENLAKWHDQHLINEVGAKETPHRNSVMVFQSFSFTLHFPVEMFSCALQPTKLKTRSLHCSSKT